MTVDLDALSGHTPGPWEWYVGRDYDQTIRKVGGGRLLSCGSQFSGGYEPDEADARLIAAAPDLLALCREQKAEIAALRGLPEGAVSSGWKPTPDREAWVRRLPRSPHDHLLARHDNGTCSWWVYQPNDRRKGTAPTLRDAMRAADNAAGVVS